MRLQQQTTTRHTSHANAIDLAGVARSNALLGRADVIARLFQRRFTQSIRNFVEIEQQMR
jgi:hypothetical protein